MQLPYFQRPLLFFNQQKFRADLLAADGRIIPLFKNALHGANVQFDRRFDEGEYIRNLIYERALFIDCILHFAWHQFDWSDDICLMAVGGYGRAELHPKSDIDLLLLFETEHASDLESAQSFLTLLWDIGLEIGHSVRDMQQCLQIAREDITVVTNLIESRALVGNESLAKEIQRLTGPEYMWPSEEFFDAKWQEQNERHEKHNNTETNLEPNIKNAPGGLRDIQTINWVAKRHFGVRTLKQLEGTGFFTDEEFDLLQSSEEFLWRVRYGLHKVVKRPEERLLFDFQHELAVELGFKGDTDKQIIEEFMHRYYRVTLALGELNDVLMHFLDEAILKKNSSNENISAINERFQLRNKYIEVTDETVFLRTPSALLEIFVLMGENEHIKGVRPETIRLLREHQNLIHEEFRNSPENNTLFMRLLRSEHGLSQQLLRMKRYNILSRYLPEFRNLIGQMQHDLFHIYTVDVHTLLVVKNMRKFRHKTAETQFPLAAECFKRINKPELLYIAGLYHDIAKGRGGDHSILGGVDAADFCRRHNISSSDTRLIVWLVENHLLMSKASQKQDLSDPEVIHQFAQIVGDQRHLDYLYLLTVADINATNPNLWTGWRDSLMLQLYSETRSALRRGLENPIDSKDIIEENKHAALRELIIQKVDEDKVMRLWDYLGDDYFLRENTSEIIWHSQAIIEHNSDEDLILIRDGNANELTGFTEIFIRTKDRDYVFAAVAAALDHLNLTIHDARIYNTARGGYTIDTFYVADADNHPIAHDNETQTKIINALKEELSLTDDYSDIVQRRIPRQLKHFTIPTRATISNNINNNSTILEVICPDRPGLLALIGRIFLQFNIQLVNAKITTLGEKVEDIFLISDQDGNPLSDPQLCHDLQTEICKQLDQQVGQD
jgi:[protein-PII] uridylyltransferase